MTQHSDPTERAGSITAATERVSEAADSDGASAADPGELERLTRPGARIGDHRVLGVIGRGGMGVVLLAEQLLPVHRQVALKLLANRRMGGRATAWFEVERQLLARMQHPAIAQIFDAGTTAEGLPYFSMELVEGEPLIRFADNHRLNLHDRLTLFRRICLGVQHAHSRGVIHRDLKPANVLVAQIDGVAMPKIIDFGIAALDSQHPQVSAPAAGTLPYMSPEQLERSTEALDPRADVFALGVMLFELIIGERPYPDDTPGRQPTSSPWQLLRSSDAQTLRRRAHERRSRPGELLAQLRGDLAAIMLKAVASDRSQRYESAAALADDLQRLLQHQPVSAVPASRLYRLSRLLRRQRLPLALVTLAFLALSSGLVLAMRSAQQAQLARELALQEAQTAQAVAEFFSQRIHGDDPGMQCNYAQYEAVGAAAQRALLTLDNRYAGRTRVLVRLRSLLASTLLSAGYNDEALSQMQHARERAREHFGHRAIETLEVELALLHVYNTLEHFGEAQKLAQDMLRRAGPLLGPSHPIALGAQVELAETRLMLSDYPQAQHMAEQLLPIARQRVAEDGGVLYEKAIAVLSQSLRMQDQTERALQLLEEQAQSYRIDPGPNSQRTLDAIENLVQMKLDAGDAEGALALLQQEVIPVYAVYCGEGEYSLGTARHLASIHLARGDAAQALEALQGWLPDAEQRPEEAQTMSEAFLHHQYAQILIQTGSLTQAIDHLLLADRILQRDLPLDDGDRQAVILDLSQTHEALGQSQQARHWASLLQTEASPEPPSSAPVQP